MGLASCQNTGNHWMPEGWLLPRYGGQDGQVDLWTPPPKVEPQMEQWAITFFSGHKNLTFFSEHWHNFNKKDKWCASILITQCLSPERLKLWIWTPTGKRGPGTQVFYCLGNYLTLDYLHKRCAASPLSFLSTYSNEKPAVASGRMKWCWCLLSILWAHSLIEPLGILSARQIPNLQILTKMTDDEMLRSTKTAASLGMCSCRTVDALLGKKDRCLNNQVAIFWIIFLNLDI